MNRRAYYVIDYDGLHRSRTFAVPEGLSTSEAVTYVYGEMFRAGWTFNTPHAVYINDGNGYQVAAGDSEVAKKVFDSIMTPSKEA